MKNTVSSLLHANISESFRGISFIMPIDSTGQALSALLYHPPSKTGVDVLAQSINGAAKGEEITVYINFSNKGFIPGAYFLKINNERLTLLSQIVILFGQDGSTPINYEEGSNLEVLLNDDGTVATDEDGNVILV